VFCGDHLIGLDRLDFDVELSRLAVAPLRDRHAVLAYGSNACPAQLRRKFLGAECSPIVPMTRAWAEDLAVGYSDHVTQYGAVPATVFESEGACTEVFVAWFDPDQFAEVDRSEARNYERRPFDLSRHDLYVADGPAPEAVDVFVSTRGLFSRGGLTPAVKGIDTTYRAGPLLTQSEVSALRARPRPVT
jgi:hypothetical protein